MPYRSPRPLASEVVTVINPATEEAIAEVALAGVEEVDAAVARSVKAGPGVAVGSSG